MNTLKKILIAIAFSALSVTFTSNATLIPAWDFIVDSAFTGSTYTAGTGIPIESNTNTQFNQPTTLSWGDQVDQSNLDISFNSIVPASNGNVSGTIITDGPANQTALLVHNNIAIPKESSVLETALLSTLLQIVPSGFPFPEPIISTPISFNILFFETPNSGGTCGGVDCSNDIFLITLPPSVIFDQGEGSLNEQFAIGQHTYNTELKLVSTLNGSGLAVLSDGICSRIDGVANGCIGLTTVEAKSNEFKVMMKVTLIPEPSSILLLSLALFGIFARMRNKHI